MLSLSLFSPPFLCHPWHRCRKTFTLLHNNITLSVWIFLSVWPSGQQQFGNFGSATPTRKEQISICQKLQYGDRECLIIPTLTNFFVHRCWKETKRRKKNINLNSLLKSQNIRSTIFKKHKQECKYKDAISMRVTQKRKRQKGGVGEGNINIHHTNINKFLHTLWNAQNDADGSWICGLLSLDLPAWFTRPDCLPPSTPFPPPLLP